MEELDGRFGQLLLPSEPGAAEAVLQGADIVETVYMTVFSVLAILLLRSFINILPYVLGSVTRPKLGREIEGSVRIARDRNFVALVFIIPFCIILTRYDIFSPDFLDPLSPGARLLTVTAIFVGYLLLRLLTGFLLKPKNRRPDAYIASRRSAYTSFIAAMLLMLTTLGILVLFRTPESAIRIVLIVEMILSYILLLVRRSEILLSFCNPFSLFLYLCALEFLPTGLFAVTALLF